jgi:hypothetical protein
MGRNLIICEWRELSKGLQKRLMRWRGAFSIQMSNKTGAKKMVARYDCVSLFESFLQPST